MNQISKSFVIPARADRASRKCRAGAAGIQDLIQVLRIHFTDWTPAVDGVTD